METPIDSLWLRESSHLAAAIPRGQSTPASRLAVAVAEYESMAARLGPIAMPRKRRPAVAIGPGATRTLAATEGEGYLPPSSEESDLRLELVVYGLGRALERSVQEARGFEHVYVGEVRA